MLLDSSDHFTRTKVMTRFTMVMARVITVIRAITRTIVRVTRWEGQLAQN